MCVCVHIKAFGKVSEINVINVQIAVLLNSLQQSLFGLVFIFVPRFIYVSSLLILFLGFRFLLLMNE